MIDVIHHKMSTVFVVKPDSFMTRLIMFQPNVKTDNEDIYDKHIEKHHDDTHDCLLISNFRRLFLDCSTLKISPLFILHREIYYSIQNNRKK